LQPYLDEILRHPAPDEFRARHNFRARIDIPGFHVTTWFDIFQTSLLAAFADLHVGVGNQRLWIGPNNHSFVYERNFWPRDPYFEWFDHWLKGERTRIMDEPAVFYSPRAWVADEKNYVADDWCQSESWPPAGIVQQKFYLTGDGRLSTDGPDGEARRYLYDPRRPIPTFGGRNMLIASDLPRESIPSRSRENGLRDPVKAGQAGVSDTQRTQVSTSSIWPVAGILAGGGTGSRAGAAVSAHCAAKSAGALSCNALCGRTWL
jgi:uncharacterized protein